jgi:hypothetical protein
MVVCNYMVGTEDLVLWLSGEAIGPEVYIYIRLSKRPKSNTIHRQPSSQGISPNIMDPVILIASVIAFATLATQNYNATYDLIDRLVGAPQVIANSKTLLSETQETWSLDSYPETSSILTSALRMIELDNNKVNGVYHHSTESN